MRKDINIYVNRIKREMKYVLKTKKKKEKILSKLIGRGNLNNKENN